MFIAELKGLCDSTFSSSLTLSYMKIRIKGNSIRYRLTQSEVAKFSIDGFLSETTTMPTQTFEYVLKAQEGLNDLAADFIGNTLTVYFPADEQKGWYASSRVGYQSEMPLSDGKTLRLLIEKDFVCLDHTDEDQSDNYPNPNRHC